MPPRGIFVEFRDGDAVCARINNVELMLKADRCREYVAEQFQPPPMAKTLTELAELAIIDTIDIADPSDPDTIWGFVTKESFKFNGRSRD